MEAQRHFEMKPWMWISLLVGAMLLVFNVDPVGNELKKLYGEGADKWAINIILVGMIMYAIYSSKKRR